MKFCVNKERGESVKNEQIKQKRRISFTFPILNPTSSDFGFYAASGFFYSATISNPTFYSAIIFEPTSIAPSDSGFFLLGDFFCDFGSKLD